MTQTPDLDGVVVQIRSTGNPFVPFPLLDNPPKAQTTGAFIDFVLLFVAISTASDMLINFGPLPKASWLLCYTLAFIRIATALPWFLALIGRNIIVLVYPGVCLVSVLWSFSTVGTLASAIQLTMTVLIGCYLGWRYSLTIVLKCFAILMVVASLLSLVHLVTSIFPWPINTAAGGLAGLFRHKTMLGQASMFAVAIIVALFLLNRNEVGWTRRPLLVLALMAALLTLLLSLSITSILVLLPMVGGILLLCLRRIPVAVAGGVLAVVTLLAAVGPLALSVAGIDPVKAVLDGVGKSSTLTGRTTLWAIAEDIRERHPYFGIGYRAFWIAPEFANGRALTYEAGARTAPSFHNFVLEILVSVGVPGLLAMLAAIAVCAQRLTSLFRRDGLPTTAAALSILGGSVFMSLTSTSLYRPHEIMIMLLAAMTVAAGEELRRPSRRARGLRRNRPD